MNLHHVKTYIFDDKGVKGCSIKFVLNDMTVAKITRVYFSVRVYCGILMTFISLYKNDSKN